MELLVFFIVIAVILIIIFSFLYSRKVIIKRKLKKAEIKRISQFKDGDIARIIGNIEFVDNPLIAPLSRRECSHYEIKVEKKVSSGKNSHWKTIIKEVKSNKFVIRDGMECAYINTNNLKAYIVKDGKYSSGFFNDASPQLEAYLQQHGYTSEGIFGLNKTMRYREGILEKDEEIAVYGMGRWKDAKELGLPDNYYRVLEITANENEHVYLSDDPATVIKEKPTYKY